MKTTKAKTPKKSRAQLEQELFDVSAQLIHHHHFVHREIDKFSTDGMMQGSSVILQLRDLSGCRKIEPIAIRNGLSPETIACLKKDIERSFEYATEFKP